MPSIFGPMAVQQFVRRNDGPPPAESRHTVANALENLDGTNQQMLLCTLCPFPSTPEDHVGPTIEATVQPNWRFQDLRFTANDTSSLIVPISHLTEQTWLNLLVYPFVKCVGLMTYVHSTTGPCMLEPVAIRVYLLREPMHQAFLMHRLCDTNFLAFETMLQMTLANTPYLIEPDGITKKRKTLWDLSSRNYEVRSTAQICDNVFWDFSTMTFTSAHKEPLTFSIRPTILVASMVNTWQSVLLQQAATLLGAASPRRRDPNTNEPLHDRWQAKHVTLVVTNALSEWTDAIGSLDLSYASSESRGISVDSLQNHSVIFTSLQNVKESKHASLALFKEVRETMTAIVRSQRSVQQLQRLIVHMFAKKYPNFILPLDLIQFGCVIIDDIESMYSEDLTFEETLGERWLQIIRDPNSTKPNSMSKAQAHLSVFGSSRFNSRSWALPHVRCLMEPMTQTIQVQKQLLRKFKIVGHSIKVTPIEERILKVFGSKYCPLSSDDAIQRFANKSMPVKVAADLIQRHFARLSTSLGSFLGPTEERPNPIVANFVMSQLELAQKSCCICFEELGQVNFGLTVCGHLYCKDCASHHFDTEWNASRTKECASCRCPLVNGDYFYIENKTYKKTQSSKDLSVQAYINSLKQKDLCEIFTYDGPIRADLFDNGISLERVEPSGDIGAPPVPEVVKNVVVPNVYVVSPKALLERYKNVPNTVHVHVFYTTNESSAFVNLVGAFS